MKKKLIVALMAALTAIGASAENLLEIVPQPIVAGSTSADARYITMQMNNDEVFTAFQFDLYLPEGVDLDDLGPVVLSDRFPLVSVRPYPQYSHTISAQRHDGGFWRVIIYSTVNAPISGNSGDLLYLYYVSDADLPDGPMPLRITNVVMAISGTEDVKPAECSSYLYTSAFSPATVSRLDLSGLAGYVPRDVVETTNSLVASNGGLTEIDLTGAADAGADFTAPNPNCLRYVTEGTALAESLSAATNVVTVGEGGAVCADFRLTDGHPACVSRGFTAAAAAYSRTVPAAGWYSLCLPFAAPAPAGVAVERFSSADAAAGTVTFVPASVEANVPCIFSTVGTEVGFEVTDAEVLPTVGAPADGPFTGTYTGMAAGSIAGCLALFADGSGFGRAGQTASVDPFRAYLSAGGGARTLRLIHGGATGVSLGQVGGMSVTGGDGCLTVTAGASDCRFTVCTADGKVLRRIDARAGQTQTLKLKSGIYIVNKTKVIVR